MENPRLEKPRVEEKKNLLSQKLVKEERDASDYYIGINIITLNPIHHCIYIYIYIYISLHYHHKPQKNLVILTSSHMSHRELFRLDQIKFRSPNSNSDNVSTFYMLVNTMFYIHSKHIDLDYHFI